MESEAVTTMARQKRLLRLALQGYFAWLLIYVLPGHYILAGTVDRVASPLVKLVFLNLPLQLVLMMLASLSLSDNRPSYGVRFSLACAVLCWLLISVHVGLSLATL